MITRQISVFAENKPGSLARVTGILAREKINIRATTIATSDTFGVINLIVDDPDRAFKALAKEGVMATMKDVIAVVIDDRPGGLDKLTQCLFKENININNAYGFVLESWKRPFSSSTWTIRKDGRGLEAEGFKMLDTDALSSLEPFHYIKY